MPEIAFAGRSNVGKSSLLNKLLGRKLARTSSTPGRTQTINYFRVNGSFYFVDLPGFGFVLRSVGGGRRLGDGGGVSMAGAAIKKPSKRSRGRFMVSESYLDMVHSSQP